ncbi:MAG: H-NS histone family protein, partial [bacterium]
MDLSKLSIAELHVLQDQITKALKDREQTERAKAREQILAIAQGVGVPLKELMGAQVRVAKTGPVTKVAVRYRHPAEVSLHWTGRGRQPKWVHEWLASGQTL